MEKNIKLISFDCFGTLIDWRKGVLETLVPLFDEYLLEISEDEIFKFFRKFDAEIINSEFMSYRSVLHEIMKSFSTALNINLMENDLDCLVKSLPAWPVFEDTPEVLRSLGNKYKLAILSNSDNDLIKKILPSLGADFDFVITSEEIQSYKPSTYNFFSALENYQLPSNQVLHVAQSIFHDIVPCNEAGIQNVWINRYNEPSPEDVLEKPGKELKNLVELRDLLL